MGGFASPARKFLICIDRLAFGCGGLPDEPGLPLAEGSNSSIENKLKKEEGKASSFS